MLHFVKIVPLVNEVFPEILSKIPQFVILKAKKTTCEDFKQESKTTISKPLAGNAGDACPSYRLQSVLRWGWWGAD